MTAKQFVRRRLNDIELTGTLLVSYAPVHRLRIWWLQLFGAQISSTATLYRGFSVRAARKLKIGERASIGDGAILDARGGLTIGNDVNLSSQVHIWTAQHGWDDSTFAFEHAPVSIGNRVWLSARVTILPGVTIGDNAVVAAGAVVTKNLEGDYLYAGVPAKRIRKRSAVTYNLPGARAKAWWW